jgi:hypothetical protein
VVLAQLVAAGDGTVTERLIAVRLGSDDRIYFYSSHAARQAVADILAAADDWEAALVADKQARARYGGETWTAGSSLTSTDRVLAYSGWVCTTAAASLLW